MKPTQPQLIATSALAPDNATHTTPFSQQTVVLTKQAYIALKWEGNYWRAQHAQLLEREAALKREVATLQATMRDLTQRLYGTKSEKASGADGTNSPKADSPKKRGQQPGSMGHGRRDRCTLPVVAEVHDLREEAKRCPTCGLAFVAFPGTATSDIVLGNGLSVSTNVCIKNGRDLYIDLDSSHSITANDYHVELAGLAAGLKYDAAADTFHL